VSCLFKVLHTRAQSDILDQALGIVRKAHAQGSVTIDIALYEELGTFLSHTAKSPMLEDGARRPANQNDKENGAEEDEAEVERFSQDLILALLGHDSFRGEGLSQPETLRKSRVRLGLVMVERRGCNASSRGQLAPILDMWLRSERSRPLREDIEKARDINARLM
jgi:hypothetical protein